jgi:glutamine amidotransferase
MLTILDYKAGNQTSVRRALDYLGIPSKITADPTEIEKSSGLIFPGVGAAGQAMNELRQTGLDKLLQSMTRAGKPLLGICVGCQILLDYSPENDTRALGIIPGQCRRFDHSLTEEDGTRINIPHMGWNRLNIKQDSPLLAGLNPESEFYFVHSYYPVPDPEFVIAETYYGTAFCSVHGKDGLWATQFHPEKSGRPGLEILSNFYDYCREAADAE